MKAKAVRLYGENDLRLEEFELPELKNGYLIKLSGDCFFKGSLIEPASCVIRGYKGSLHPDADGDPYANIKPGGKKLIYTHIELPLTAISDFETLGKTDSRFLALDGPVKKNNGLWSAEAEAYLLKNF